MVDWDNHEAFRDATGESKDRKRTSWQKRLFSNRAARFVAGAGVPYSMTGDDSSQGQLVQAVAEFGWTITDSDAQADDLLASAPFRAGGYRAGHVVQGRFDPITNRSAAGLPSGEWSFTAFDAVEDSKLGRAVGHCFTATPTMITLPQLRILPSRFLTGPARGMQVFPTVDPIFDARFKLLARNGEAELAAFTGLINEEVRSVMCAGPDLDEIWTANGQLVISRSMPHDEVTLAHHLEVLAAMLRALRQTDELTL